ncbi:polysaccharide biosynthesis C-terminal domain-containing protein [Oceanirhabdus sp. W0125-5]|uniref:polysaccharide biosynthesis C-terminal domain-containing protein n=1 Tax=Oceanirhabdus sp. W0125-5 TaxID=2999116 RepID=UPI0022F2A8CE|nr:hypothetical protein [Oceanirhabdus sp. W0125-5]WBW96066.1 hypothetical protein OW730_20580 [Oceanirhabdus sp. W0125-5]
MTQKGFTIKKLLVYEESFNGEKESICRMINQKGELAVLSTQEINFIAYVDYPQKGEPRGNHYHKNKMEYLYLCKGKIRGYFRDYKEANNNVETVDIEAGSLILIYPGCTHKFEVIEEGHAIEFSPTKIELLKGDNIKDFI